MLGRVRAAIGGAEPEPLERRYRREGALGPEARVELFCERVGEYRAEVQRLAAADVGAAVADVCARRGAGTLVAPEGVPAGWRPTGVEVLADHRLTARELDTVGGV